jgi:hypothetical protein
LVIKRGDFRPLVLAFSIKLQCKYSYFFENYNFLLKK